MCHFLSVLTTSVNDPPRPFGGPPDGIVLAQGHNALHGPVRRQCPPAATARDVRAEGLTQGGYGHVVGRLKVVQVEDEGTSSWVRR